MKEIHVYLVSDSTGETVSSVARSALSQFQGIIVEEHLWSFVQTTGKLDKLGRAIVKNPGIVMFTLANHELGEQIRKLCEELKVLCIPVLSRVVSDLSSYLNLQTNAKIGKQHELNANYFSRVDAVNFSLAHDDGQSVWDLEEADITLVGVSRTSKSPTCLYLAYKGYRTANIPYVSGSELPKNLFNLKRTLILGLTINPEVLVQIRKNRILSLSIKEDTKYVNNTEVAEELKEAKRIYIKNNWPIIDVTRRSVEETAALILQYFEKKKIRDQRKDEAEE